MQTNTRIQDVQGTAAQTWGNVFVPVSGGTVTLTVKGDLLEARIKLRMGTQTIWTRIQTVSSIEINHSPALALIVLGILIILTGLGMMASSVSLGLIILAVGIAITVYAWVNKRRLMVIYASNSVIPVFMTKPTETYEKFGMGILAMARHLNHPLQPTQRPPTKRP